MLLSRWLGDWVDIVTLQTLRADLQAGLLGALLVLPQGIAFATLAGLPPQYGLYSAVLPGNAAKRIAVIQHGARAYLFVAAVRGQASLESQDAEFLSVIKSFRPMTAAEYKQAQPQRLQLVKVKPGQTLESLAKDSPLSGDAVKALRLLNNLYPSGQPRPGDWLKVVR